MNEQPLVISYENLLAAFNSLTSRLQKSLLRKSARQSLKILLNEAKLTIRSVTNLNNKRIKFGSMRKGIKLMGYKKKVGANVNLFGDYRLKWFETGTRERYTKKRFTGKLKQAQFFRTANLNKMSAVYEDFERRVVDNVVSTFNKKYGLS